MAETIALDHVREFHMIRSHLESAAHHIEEAAALLTEGELIGLAAERLGGVVTKLAVARTENKRRGIA